jgi:hypothetical protein
LQATEQPAEVIVIGAEFIFARMPRLRNVRYGVEKVRTANSSRASAQADLQYKRLARPRRVTTAPTNHAILPGRKIGYGTRVRRLALLSAPCLLLAAPAWADGPLQPWPTLSVTVGLGGKWAGTVETLARLPRAAGRANQYRWRLQLARALSSRLTVAVSSGHLITDNDGRRDGIEDQLVEQLTWTVGKIGPVTVTTRTRLEQRFIVGNDRLA